MATPTGCLGFQLLLVVSVLLCPPGDTAIEVVDQPFDAESIGDSEDADLVPLQSGEDWVAQLDDDLSRPASRSGENFCITALQLQDSTCITLLVWIRSDAFPPWAEVKSLCPELRLLWHHRNNLSADANGVIWRKRSSPGSELQLLVPKPAREQFDHFRHSLHRTAARRKRLYDVKAVNRKFPVGSWVLRYYPPAAQRKLGSPWVGPQQVVRQATGHTVGIQKGPDALIIFIHVDNLKLCPAPVMLLGPQDRQQQNHFVLEP